MLFNPVFNREIRSAVRSGRCFWVAALYALVLGLVALNAWPTKEQALWGARVGERIFERFTLLQLALALLFAPALTWSAISGEKEGRTWSTLRCTPLQPFTIVFGKLMAAVVQLFLFVLASLPVVSYCFFLGGVAPAEVRTTYLNCLLASLAAGSAGLCCSAICRKTSLAIVVTYLCVACIACALWALDNLWYVGGLLVAFCAGAVVLARRTVEREVTSAPFASSASLAPDDGMNPIVARELAALTRTGRRAFVRVVYWLAPLLALALFVLLWKVGDAGLTKRYFACYSVVQLAAVILSALALGACALTGEKEQRTFPLLLSTPLSPRAILGGKLCVVYWHVLLLTLASVPVLSLATLLQVTAFADALRLLLAQLIYGFAFAIIGLFFSLRAKRTNKALGLALAFLLVVGSASAQLLPLSRTLSGSRYGQLLVATNPMHTLWESARPQAWETARRLPPRRIKVPPNVHRWYVSRAGDGRTFIYFYSPRGGLREVREVRPRPRAPEVEGAFIALHDLPFLSVFAVSVVGYLLLAAALWALMRRRFWAWSLLAP